jgi:hypothetical protein
MKLDRRRDLGRIALAVGFKSSVIRFESQKPLWVASRQYVTVVGIMSCSVGIELVGTSGTTSRG